MRELGNLSLRLPGVSAEIGSTHIPNIRPELYHHTNPLGVFPLMQRMCSYYNQEIDISVNNINQFGLLIDTWFDFSE
jgi:hypothetical protein